jgi:hypothetical protein
MNEYRQFPRTTLWLTCLFIVTALLFVARLFTAPKPVYSAQVQLTRSTSGVPSPDRWDFSSFSVTYQINPSVGANVGGGSGPAVSAVQHAFGTWKAAPNSSLQISQGANSAVAAPAFDGVNLICFVCQADFAKDSSTLAVTLTTTADAAGEDTKHNTGSKFAGQILDADIIFNPAVQWVTNGQPGTNQEDLQTVATHEVGHFFGLDHSAVVRAVMYPFGGGTLTTLSYDDVAGLMQLYPKSSPDYATGKISGTVTFANGGAIFGAHVFADSTTNSAPPVGGIRKSPIGTLTAPDGTYTIVGLPQDSYTVAAEPLDGPVTNSNLSEYAPAYGLPAVQANFNTRWH